MVNALHRRAVSPVAKRPGFLLGSAYNRGQITKSEKGTTGYDTANYDQLLH